MVVEEAPDAKDELKLPGWGDWGGLGARPSKRQKQRELNAAEARSQLLAAAAARRQVRPSQHVDLSLPLQQVYYCLAVNLLLLPIDRTRRYVM